MVTHVHIEYNTFFEVLGYVLSSFDMIHVLCLNSHIFGTVVCFIAIQEGVYLG